MNVEESIVKRTKADMRFYGNPDVTKEIGWTQYRLDLVNIQKLPSKAIMV